MSVLSTFFRLLVAFTLTSCAIGSAPSNAGGEAFSPTHPDPVVKTDAEWKTELSAEEYHILRKKGTERAFTGKYWNAKQPGIYHCAGCGLALFSSETKFDSGTGWPSFHSAIVSDHVAEQKDGTLGMVRTEILCNRCGGHLGHVFDDGPAPTGQRFCVNGTALDFKPEPTTEKQTADKD